MIFEHTGIRTGILHARILRTGVRKAGLAAAGLLLAAGSSLALPAGTASAASRPTSPKTLMAAALRTAGKETSVHFVATSRVGTRSITVTASAAAKAAVQTISIAEGKTKGRVRARFVDRVVYFQGDKVGLEVYLGMPSTLAPKYAGKWISFSPSTQDYSAIAKSMTLSTALSQISVDKPFGGGRDSTVDGEPAVDVTGTTTTFSSKGNHGKATLYVSATGTLLPIRYVGTGREDKQRETGQVTFSDWDAKVKPVKPSSSVAASSITTSG